MLRRGRLSLWHGDLIVQFEDRQRVIVTGAARGFARVLAHILFVELAAARIILWTALRPIPAGESRIERQRREGLDAAPQAIPLAPLRFRHVNAAASFKDLATPTAQRETATHVLRSSDGPLIYTCKLGRRFARFVFWALAFVRGL